MSHYTIPITNGRLPDTAGAKAQNLSFLRRKGFLVPDGFVCLNDAHERFCGGDLSVLSVMTGELSAKVSPDRTYAVRSSAGLEDGLIYSFAGQFKTVLGVPGAPAAIVEAIRSVWEACGSHEVQTYLRMTHPDRPSVKMAVVIQEMVQQVLSGVAFSKNPLTGMDEIVVEAVRGSGTALVQDGATPSRWVYKWGRWIEGDTTDAADSAVASLVVEQTRAIAKAFGRPVDLEWVYDGQRLYWVQLREITSLNQVEVYSNRVAKEMLPGLVKDLVWSVNVPLVNGTWVRLFTEAIGPNDIDPNSLAKPFYYRAYFNVTAIGRIFEMLGLPRESIELMMGLAPESAERPRFKPTAKMLALLPRLLFFVAHKLRVSGQVDQFVAAMEAHYRSQAVLGFATMDEASLLSQVKELYALNQETAYYNIVIPLSMSIYSMMLNKQLAKVGVDFALFDLTHGLEGFQEVDPNVGLARLRSLFTTLDPAKQAEVLSATYPEFEQMEGVESLRAGVRLFLAQFGHLSDSGNDFSVMPWRERPEMVLKMLAGPTSTGESPAKRLRYEDLSLSPFRRAVVGPLYRLARQSRLNRERVSSLYTLGYGLFRDLFLALGERFVARALLKDRDDIFYLSLAEVRAAVEAGAAAASLIEVVSARRQNMEEARRVNPPGVIYGERPFAVEALSGTKLKGIPTARGIYTGPAKVVQGMGDFEKVLPGDVLAIPYSDVGWTPLFAKAGAVIAESGGLLSHSSIVAREYGIPAVVSVAGACLLSDGTTVTVDGYTGEVVVHDKPYEAAGSGEILGSAR